MGERLLALSDTSVENSSSALIQSINESSRLARRSEAPYISQESQILLLSILGQYEAALVSLPPDEEVVLPMHQKQGYVVAYRRVSLECTHARDLLRHWKTIAKLKHIARGALRRIFEAWRYMAEEAYVADILHVFEQRQLLRALSSWKYAFSQVYACQVYQLADVFRRGRTTQRAFDGWVDRYNHCQVAAYGVTIRRLARLFAAFRRTYAYGRVRLAVRHALVKCAFRGLWFELRGRAFHRRLLSKVALGSVLQQASRLLLTQYQSVERIQAAEKAMLARNRMFAGAISHKRDVSYAQSDSGCEAEEEAQYFKNVNTRFVQQKAAELRGSDPPIYLTSACPTADTGFGGAAECSASFLGPGNPGYEADQPTLVSLLPGSSAVEHTTNTVPDTLSKSCTLAQSTTAACSTQENVSDEFPGQLEERLGQRASSANDSTGIYAQVVRLRERIARLRDLSSERALRGAVRLGFDYQCGQKANWQGLHGFIRPDGLLRPYRTGEEVGKANNYYHHATRARKPEYGGNPRVLALAGLIKAVERGLQHCLLRRAFYEYYVLMLYKTAYSAGLSFALKYSKAKATLKAFLALLAAFTAVRARALAIERARTACESCQKRFFLSLLRLHGRLSALCRAKQRYLTREFQFRALAHAFNAWRAKAAALAFCGHRQRAIQARCATVLKRQVFNYVAAYFELICRMRSRAVEYDQRRLRFRVFLCFKTLQTRRAAFGASNDALRAIMAEVGDLTALARPGGWYDECFPGVRSCFSAWRRRAEYGCTLERIGQKMLSQQSAALAAAVLAKWRLLDRGLQCARLKEHFLKRRMLSRWLKTSLQAARYAVFCRRHACYGERMAFRALVDKLRSQKLVYQAEARIAERRALRVKKEVLQSLLYGSFAALAQRELEALISAAFARFLKFKALFALAARFAGPSRAQRAGAQCEGATGSIDRQMALLKAPQLVFRKCLTWQRYVAAGSFRQLYVRIAAYSLEPPQFDFKIAFLSGLYQAPANGVYYTIRARLRAKIFAETASAGQKALTLSQLDSKMAGIQQRIERLKK